MKFDNTNKGGLWVTLEKLTDKHPDYKGSLNIEGVDYWLSGWKREEGGNPASPAVRLTVKRKQKSRMPQNDNTDDFDPLNLPIF